MRPDSGVLDPAQLAILRDLQLPTEADALQVFANLFEEDAPQRLETLRAAVLGEDIPAIVRAAHAIKAGAGAIGAMLLEAACGELERSAPTSAAGHSSALMDRIDAAYAATCEALHNELESVHDAPN